MIKTFRAKEPGRYVQIQHNSTMSADVPHKIENDVTDYKMVIDLESKTYNSYIKQNGLGWEPLSVNKKVTNMTEFWKEVGEGHLVELLK